MTANYYKQLALKTKPKLIKHVAVLPTVAVATFRTKTVTVTMKCTGSVKADVEEQIRKMRLEIKIQA